MENTNIVFKYFDNALVQRVLDLNDITDIDVRMALKDEIIETYKAKDVALKAEIVTQLAEAKARHLNNISELDGNLATDLAKASQEHQDALDSKEFKNVKFGLEIACKRAKIKEKYRYNDEIKEIKLQRVFLHEEYTKLLYNVTGTISPIESLRNKALESKATFNLKASLTDKKFWVNLVPLFMLILIIAAYFIGKSITGYSGNLGDVINNSIFVAVVATGAVFIYSQGGFDMSLGNASLMCATVASLTYNSTGNLAVSLHRSLFLISPAVFYPVSSAV